ncbi:MAG: phospholipase D-like domain-containing protein, partial [Candidatus Anammoxibacter sp.]
MKQVIDQAEEAIYMVMYLVNVDERNPKSRVYQLSQSLIDAHERGVAVTIILDQSVDYSRTKRGELWQTEGKNDNAFRLFKEHGLDVSYDKTSILTHSKILIIDKEIVIVGSTNWSEYALERNNESSVLIRSSELADQYIEQLSQIRIDEQASQ